MASVRWFERSDPRDGHQFGEHVEVERHGHQLRGDIHRHQLAIGDHRLATAAGAGAS